MASFEQAPGQQQSQYPSLDPYASSNGRSSSNNNPFVGSNSGSGDTFEGNNNTFGGNSNPVDETAGRGGNMYDNAKISKVNNAIISTYLTRASLFSRTSSYRH